MAYWLVLFSIIALATGFVGFNVTEESVASASRMLFYVNCLFLLLVLCCPKNPSNFE